MTKKRHNLQQRALIIQSVRSFFATAGFLEVETPLRIPAPAPEAHIEAIAAGSWFLQTSPELCMKRILASGFAQIYQISHCWRGGERGSRHLSEFTMLEWYRTHADYSHLMRDCTDLLKSVAQIAGSSTEIVYQGKRIALDGEWELLTVADAFLHYGGMDVANAVRDDCFDEIMAEKIEPNLGRTRPTFLYDYPIERAALARPKSGNPSVAERFELYLAGIELANGFSELTDPIEQRRRFSAEESIRRSNGHPPYPTAEKFLIDLEEMPPAAGIALGIDRLVMLLVNAAIIDEVVAFTPEEL